MTTFRVTTTVFMKAILMALCLLPILAAVTPTIIVDSIPAGAAFFNLATVKPPYHDLDEVDSKEVEAGIASVISDAMQLRGDAVRPARQGETTLEAIVLLPLFGPLHLSGEWQLPY